jgi:hypothetical protein
LLAQQHLAKSIAIWGYLGGTVSIPPIPLTDVAIKKAKPKDKPYKLTDSDGMFLHVQPIGAKYWRLNYCSAGKEKLLAGRA